MAKPKFTIVMASYLGPYPTAAKGRHEKIHRAIQSVINQTFTEWQLIIVADGCQETFKQVENYIEFQGRIDCLLINKCPMFDGGPRNVGIKFAQGEWILYLDIDDNFGPDHLQIIADEIDNKITSDKIKWAWFNDLIYKPALKTFAERTCNINQKYRHGTSNLVHRANSGALWKTAGYAHDYHFTEELKKISPITMQLKTPQYYVNHIPRVYDI